MSTGCSRAYCEKDGVDTKCLSTTIGWRGDRVKYEMTRDKGIRLRVEELIQILSNSQA